MDGFIKIPMSIIEKKDLTPIQMILLGIIVSLSNKKGKCWASNQYLGDLLGVAPRTITRNITILKEKGYLEWGWTQMSRGVDTNVQGGRTLMSTNIDNIIDKEDISKDISKKDEMFELFWKTYPHYESRSKKKDARKYRPTKDAKQLLTSVKILKRRVELGLQAANWVKGCHLRIRDFEPQSEAITKSLIKEIFKKHMELDGEDMRERMLKIKEDFPDVDFKKLHKERSDEKSLLNKLNFS